MHACTRTRLALLTLGSLTACFSGRDITTGIDCESTQNCPEGYYCSRDGGCFPAEERWPEDTFCSDDSFCLEEDHCQSGGYCWPGARTSCTALECAAVGPQVFCRANQCLRAACFNDYNCGPDQRCDGFACLPGVAAGSNLVDGQHCTDDYQCSGGQCLYFTEQPTNLFCSRACDGNYPDVGCTGQTYCSPDNAVCLPRGVLALGAACTSNGACHSGLCLNNGSEKYCSAWCRQASDCPGDWQCYVLTGLPSGIDVGGCVQP